MCVGLSCKVLIDVLLFLNGLGVLLVSSWSGEYDYFVVSDLTAMEQSKVLEYLCSCEVWVRGSRDADFLRDRIIVIG